MKRWLGQTLALALFAGCGAGAPASSGTSGGTGSTGALVSDTGMPASCAAVPFGITVGQGNETTFTPGATGDLLVLYFGRQGGWHVDAAALVAGVGPASTVELSWTLTVLDEGWVVGEPEQPFFTLLQPYDASACSGNVYGALAHLDRLDQVPGEDTFARGCALDGKAMRMDLTVTTSDGRTASASVDGVAAVDLGVLGDCPPAR